MATFDELKPTITKYLSEVYEFSVPDYQVERLREIFLRYKAQFMEKYFLPTIEKLRSLKYSMRFPLHFDRKLVILLSPPLQLLQEGDFYFQAGVSTPGTVSLKYQFQGKLYPTTLTEVDLDRLLDESLYTEVCRGAGLDRNIFRSLLVRGDNAYHSVAVTDLSRLVDKARSDSALNCSAGNEGRDSKREWRNIRGLSFDSSYATSPQQVVDWSFRRHSSTDCGAQNLPILCRQLNPSQMDAICSLLNPPGNNDWRHLAYYLLSYNHGEVSAIARNSNPCMVVLDNWMEKQGDEATTSRLLDVLQQLQRYDVIDALKKPSRSKLWNSGNESASASQATLSPTRDIAPVRQPVGREEKDMKPMQVSQQHSSTTQGKLVQQMSTDHEDPFPSTLAQTSADKAVEPRVPLPVSEEVQQSSSADQATFRPMSDSDTNTSPVNSPYPETRKDLANKATEQALHVSHQNSSTFGNWPCSDTDSNSAEKQTTAIGSTNHPVPIQDEDGAIPPSKEADDLAAAAVVTAPDSSFSPTKTIIPVSEEEVQRSADQTTFRPLPGTDTSTSPVNRQYPEIRKDLANRGIEQAMKTLHMSDQNSSTCPCPGTDSSLSRTETTAIGSRIDPVPVQDDDDAIPPSKEIAELAAVAAALTAPDPIISPTASKMIVPDSEQLDQSSLSNRIPTFQPDSSLAYFPYPEPNNSQYPHPATSLAAINNTRSKKADEHAAVHTTATLETSTASGGSQYPFLSPSQVQQVSQGTHATSSVDDHQ